MQKTGLYVSLLASLTFVSFASAKEAPKADNTTQNKGAMSSDAVTAEKQGNDKSQVAVLAEVRKSIVADKRLSMDAKNVKILFSKGLLTLRGPVDSEEEKSKVEELARTSSGVSNVKNLLTVAPKSR